jgi:hypothetical protein
MMTGITFCTKEKTKVIVACNLPENVSFNSDIMPVLQNNCAISGCHSGSKPAANLNLDVAHAYFSLMKNGSGYIDTINPRYSLLYSQMVSRSQPMPPTGRLDSCTTSLILKWIGQQARHN